MPALLLLVAVLAWAYARLWHAPDARAAAIGAFALGAAAVHANVDYIFHFPAIPMAAAAIVGAAVPQPARNGTGWAAVESPANETLRR